MYVLLLIVVPKDTAGSHPEYNKTYTCTSEVLYNFVYLTLEYTLWLSLYSQLLKRHIMRLDWASMDNCDTSSNGSG